MCVCVCVCVCVSKSDAESECCTCLRACAQVCLDNMCVCVCAQGSASLSPMHSHTGAASRTTSQPGSSTPQAPVQVSSDGTVATATAADTSPTTSQQQSGLSGPTTSGGATGGPVVGIISNGQVVDTQLASSTFANLQSQQQVTEAGGLDNSQNGGDMAAMELARTVSLTRQ